MHKGSHCGWEVPLPSSVELVYHDKQLQLEIVVNSASLLSYLLDTHSQIPRRVPDIIMAEEVQKGPTVEPTSVDEKEHLTVTAGGTVVDHGLHRQLKQRHMQMISLGGVIGYGSRLLLIATR